MLIWSLAGTLQANVTRFVDHSRVPAPQIIDFQFEIIFVCDSHGSPLPHIGE